MADNTLPSRRGLLRGVILAGVAGISMQAPSADAEVSVIDGGRP